MIGIVLAAGDGIRLKKSSGENCCKVLEKVNDIRLIEFSLNNLLKLNITDVFVVVGKEGNLIKEAIGNKYKDLKITYIYQPYQKGLIDALVQALNTVKYDSAILQLADEIFIGLKFKMIKRIINADEYDFYCGITYESDDRKIRANYSVETDDNMLINRCTEKPKHVVNNLKGTGFCIFKGNTLKLLNERFDDKKDKLNDLCDFMNFLVSQNKKGIAFCVADKEFNVNTAADLTEATEYLIQSGELTL